jgi:hypothetical protein
MRAKQLLAITCFCSLTALCACQVPPAAPGPTSMTLQLSDYDTYVNDALTVLRRYDFDPRYVDRARGTILTEPATSAQWFEFWRVDARGPYQTAEANLHSMQRRVHLTIQPVNDDPERREAPTGSGEFDVTVEVEKYRYSAPERQVTTASGALNLYSARIPTTAGVRGPRAGTVDWTPLGRDPLLEAFLLEKLATAAR